MSAFETPFHAVACSLADLLGNDYLAAVCDARAALSGESVDALQACAKVVVEFYPSERHQQQIDLLPHVGQAWGTRAFTSAAGATTRKFIEATKTGMAPVNGFGFFRAGEDGRLYLTTKSEHYHAPLGHAFPGYQLIDIAKRLGIPNATHNNTRGHVTRLLEEELIRTAHGIAGDDGAALEAVLASQDLQSANRVLNLETGSIACEAALKMMLARFYQVQDDAPVPVYHGRTPVFLVVGNEDGGLPANYHGTTVLAQTLRGMWPELLALMEQHGMLCVRAIRPNNLDDLAAAFTQYEQGPYKIAGFTHEIIMMNYGARVLSRDFLQRAYALCQAHDVPTFVDEIQSCLWAPGLYLFREYGLRPTFVSVGKGFPGGEYPASRILFSAAMDTLPQFGALVTNGQEELASLAYLITMRWALANTEVTRGIGDYYEARVRAFAAAHTETIAEVTGQRQMSALAFHDLATAKAFTTRLNTMGLDISAQTYKADCPPVVLTKLPLTACREVVDFVVAGMEEAIIATRQATIV